MSMFNYESDEIAKICQGTHSSDTLYVADCKQTIIQGVKGSYPQLCEYEQEWLNYGRTHYEGGNPSNLEYQSVIVNPQATVDNAIPFHYKSAILKGNTIDNILNFDQRLTMNNTVKDFSFLFPPKLDKKYVLEIELTNVTPAKGDSDYIAIRGVRENRGIYEITRLTQSFADGTYEIPITFNENYSILRVAVSFRITITNMKLKGELLSVQMPVLTTSNGDGTKTNILTVNEDVTLRGIGDVQDTLDCLTGEVVNRIDKVVLDGSENWSVNNSNNDGFYSCSTTTYIGKSDGAIISDKLPSITSTKAEGVMLGVSTGKVMVSFNRESNGVTNLDSFKEKLAQNPITILYELETETVKTVDLSTIIKPYEGTNHYTVSSDTIPPQLLLSLPVVSTGAKTLNDIITEE